MRNNCEIYPDSSASNLMFKTKAILLADHVLGLVASLPDLTKSLRSEVFSLREALVYCDPCSIEAVAFAESKVLQFLEDLKQELLMMPDLETHDTDRSRYLISHIHRELTHRNTLLLALKQQS